MGQSDFPLCIYCNNSDKWFLSHKSENISYHCGECSNTVIVKVSDD